MVPASSVKVPRVSTYSGSRLVNFPFAYGAFTLSGRLSQNRSAKLTESIPRSEPQDARTLVWALPISLAATFGITCCFLFLRLLRCFSSPGCLLMSYEFTHGFLHITAEGFPHSDICGSTVVCTSPQLFAACHVLLRLLLPRHPPYALCFLTFSRSYSFSALFLSEKILEKTSFSLEIAVNYPCFAFAC